MKIVKQYGGLRLLDSRSYFLLFSTICLRILRVFAVETLLHVRFANKTRDQDSFFFSPVVSFNIFSPSSRLSLVSCLVYADWVSENDKSNNKKNHLLKKQSI